VTCPFREWDVAYVLGSLSSDDRQAYERHLVACAPCEHEVCGLAGTAGLLSRVPAEWAMESLSPGVPARRRPFVTPATILAAVAIGAALAFLLCRRRNGTS
jgi:anti-sigma factor RsiW